jgi:hypothetical protein
MLGANRNTYAPQTGRTPTTDGVRRTAVPDSSLIIYSAPSLTALVRATTRDGCYAAAYILAGSNALAAPGDDGRLRIYVGESGCVPKRLSKHRRDAARSYATQFYVITSEEPEFSKTDAVALQFLFHEAAEAAGVVVLDRVLKPTRPHMSERAWHWMRRECALCTKALTAHGLDLTQQPQASSRDNHRHRSLAEAMTSRPSSKEAEKQANDITAAPAGQAQIIPLHTLRRGRTYIGASMLPHGNPSRADKARDAALARGLIFRLRYDGVIAHAQQLPEGFVVLADSTFRREIAPSFSDAANLSRRDALLSSGVLENVPDNPRLLRLSRSTAFESRAIAAKVLTGCNINADWWTPIPLDLGSQADQRRERRSSG